jgi:hypothetical protein
MRYFDTGLLARTPEILAAWNAFHVTVTAFSSFELGKHGTAYATRPCGSHEDSIIIAPNLAADDHVSVVRHPKCGQWKRRDL